ncbi:MAG: Mrp/NBP35 family ATP-binding protein [Paracoccus sp. (in: a-proteobacteria)]|nr:Mrp/NBP35 family ATP-binding protein [Paracoccus sp. (in: a-proteobacteria)]
MSDNLIEQARAILSALALPGGGVLGGSDRLVGPSLAGGRLSAAIAVTPDEAAAFEPLRQQAQEALHAIAPGAMVTLTAQAAPQPSAQPPRLGNAPENGLSRVRHIIAVASGKGGVGKSTTAANLALALRALGLRVGLLDADIHGPSVPTLLGLHAAPRVTAERRLIPAEAHGISAMSMGLLVDPETAMIWRGPMVQSALKQLLHEVEWGQLDVLVLDMPPGTGDAQLAIAQGVGIAGAVIVSTPQDLALIDARRGIAMFRKTDVPILGVVENMAHFICPDCGNRHAIFGQAGARDEAARLGVPFLGEVPLTMELRQASDAGRPVVSLDPGGVLGQAYINIARAVLDRLTSAAQPQQQQ